MLVNGRDLVTQVPTQLLYIRGNKKVFISSEIQTYMIFQRRHYPHQIFCSNGRPVEFYKTSSSKTILLDVQQTYFSAISVAMEAHVLTHNPPNHLQVVPRHYHGDRSKLLYFRGHGTSYSSKSLEFPHSSRNGRKDFTATAVVLPWPWKLEIV